MDFFTLADADRDGSLADSAWLPKKSEEVEVIASEGTCPLMRASKL